MHGLHPGNTRVPERKPQVERLSPMTSADTHCPYCALQCAMTLGRAADGSVTVDGRDFPVNGGGLCQKGWTSAALLGHPERLTTPLVRDGGRLRPAGWDE